MNQIANTIRIMVLRFSISTIDEVVHRLCLGLARGIVLCVDNVKDRKM